MMSRIEMNCVACMVIFLFTVSCGSGRAVPDHPNIILIVIDTLRADHLSCYGYYRETSPAIDSLAEAGTRWENCQSQAPWTPPSTASIMSGLNVRQHGTGRRANSGDHILHPEMPVLPVLFQEAGYRTCGIFNVMHMNELRGYSEGYDHYSCVDDGNGRAAEVVDEFLQWVESDNDDRPFMAVLHFFDVHKPYDPPAPFSQLYLPGDTITASVLEVVEDGT